MPGLMDETEAQLVERAKDDSTAFGLLYERYVDRIYSYIYYRVGDTREAEDLTARVFFRALGRINKFRQRGAPFVSWLYRIAHNLVANWHRDRGRRNDVSLDVLLDLHAPDLPHVNAVEQAEHMRVLLAAMRRLPVDRQQILILKFVDDLTNAEIGQIMGRSEGAVKSLYHRTLLELRQDPELDHFFDQEDKNG